MSIYSLPTLPVLFTPSGCGPKTDVVFILDSSSTVGWETFNRIKMYAEILMRSMNVDSCDINVGAMKYSSAAMIQFR